jgi:magnesium transporter
MNTARQLLPGVPWFDIPDPASPDLDELAQRFHLHELQIEDTRHRPQRAKVDEYGNYAFAVLKHLHPGDKPMFDDFDVFLGSNFLITVHQGDAPLLAKVCQRVQENHIDRLDRILYVLMDLIVDEYLTYLDNSAEAISKVESQVLKRPEPQTLRDIFRLKRRLIDFRRNAAGMRDVVNAIIRREGGLVGDDLDPYFRDIYDHLVRAVDLVEAHRDLLTNSLDIFLPSPIAPTKS